MPTFKDCFCAAEEKALCFLIDTQGFRRKERTVSAEGSNMTGGVVCYSSEGARRIGAPKGWTVSLAFTPARLELSLDIADEHGNTFSVEELHALVTSDPFPKCMHNLSDSLRDEEAQFSEFARLAAVLRASGTRFFAGDRSLWKELRAARHRSWQAEEDRCAVALSEDAFRAKDWHRVVAALEPREARLSKAATARLALSRKRLLSAA